LNAWAAALIAPAVALPRGVLRWPAVLQHLDEERGGLFALRVLLAADDAAKLGDEIRSGTSVCQWRVDFGVCSVHVHGRSALIGRAKLEKPNAFSMGWYIGTTPGRVFILDEDRVILPEERSISRLPIKWNRFAHISEMLARRICIKDNLRRMRAGRDPLVGMIILDTNCGRIHRECNGLLDCIRTALRAGPTRENCLGLCCADAAGQLECFPQHNLVTG
jgi:hypothetical protein